MKRAYPRLAQLCGCYLHQDWLTEFDTPRAAVAAYKAHVSRNDWAAAQKEIAHLLAHTGEEAQLLAELERLGSYYWPAGDGLTARQWLEQVALQLAEA